jgi:chromosome partitioning protein
VSTTIAIANQKGGVGKTTSAVSLSSEFALKGLRTLLIDLDPQGNATSGLGIELREAGEDLFDMFLGKSTLESIVRASIIKGLDVAPSSADLVGIEIELGKVAGRELILKTQLELLKKKYDLIIIDCPPSSGLLSLNALGAAQKVLVPLQSEYYALEGLSALIRTIQFVQQTFNPKLELLGVFLTMFDARTNLSIQVELEAKQFFGSELFTTRIPRNIKLSEAPSHSKPICMYDAQSAGAKAYAALGEEILTRLGHTISKDETTHNSNDSQIEVANS